MKKPVEGVDDQKDDQNGHNYLICVTINNTRGMRKGWVGNLYDTVNTF